VHALAGKGKAKHRLRLRFRVSDNSGKAALALGVYRGKHTALKRSLSIKPVSSRRTYHLSWKPLHAGSYRFCVAAADAAGNHSGSCATVKVRRR
jgi:hypothetical protein